MSKPSAEMCKALETLQVQRFILTVIGGDDADRMNGIVDDHDLTFEPYASMDIRRVAELLNQAFRARDVRKFAMLGEFFFDKLSAEENRLDGLATSILHAILKDIGMLRPEAIEGVIGLCYRLAVEAIEGKVPGEAPR